jgi:hypothetical protein
MRHALAILPLIALVAACASQPVATQQPAPSALASGSVDIHDGNTESEGPANDPKVCEFHIHFFMGRSNSGDWEIRTQPGDTLVLSGPWSSGSAEDVRVPPAPDLYSLSDGQYKLSWTQVLAKPGAKQKVFKVECGSAVVSPDPSQTAAVPSPTETTAASPSDSVPPSPAPSTSPTPDAGGSATPSTAPSPTATASPTPPASVAPTDAPSSSATAEPEITPTPSPAPTPRPTASATPRPTSTPQPTSTPSPTPTTVPTPPPTPDATGSQPIEPEQTAMPKPTATVVPTASPKPTATAKPSTGGAKPTNPPTDSAPLSPDGIRAGDSSWTLLLLALSGAFGAVAVLRRRR